MVCRIKADDSHRMNAYHGDAVTGDCRDKPESRAPAFVAKGSPIREAKMAPEPVRLSTRGGIGCGTCESGSTSG